MSRRGRRHDAGDPQDPADDAGAADEERDRRGDDGRGDDGRGDDRPAASARRPPVHERPIDALPTNEQLVRGSTIATAVFVVAAGLSAARPDWFAWLGVVVSIALFAAGCVAFVVGYARAVPRSRVDEMDLPGLFFLVDSVDKAVRSRLLLLLFLQIAVGLGAAAVRPFTPVAFCTLTPVFGLGVLGLCGATHGRFPPRQA
ncbi:MAG: hypothetical protein AB7W59_09160 [Acidimicrobiia bacterium]